jgi:hypothetical protein
MMNDSHQLLGSQETRASKGLKMLRHSCLRSIVLFLAIAAVDDVAQARTWTDKTGRFKVEAELIEVKDGMVRLQKTDGKKLSVPLEKLSEADQAVANETIVPEDSRVAVIGRGEAARNLSALIEMKLGASKGVTLLERGEIDRIIGEQELQAAFAPEGAGKRCELGRLLKADLLVLIESHDKPAPHVQLVVCQTAEGVRLCAQPVLLSPKAEDDVATMIDLIEKARRKQRGKAVEIVAVPPLVNNSLTHETDYLQAAFSQLIERDLLQRPNVVVVAFAEAQAIAREMAIGGGKLKRHLPLYLLGDYRIEGIDAARRCRFAMKLLRGTTELGRCERKNQPPAETSGELRRAAAELFDRSLGNSAPSVDANVEAQQTADRARTFMKISNWPEAATLFETSLLLKPDQPLVHRDALLIYNELAYRELHGDTRREFSGGSHVARYDSHFVQACNFRRLTLAHMEPYFLATEIAMPDLQHIIDFGPGSIDMIQPFPSIKRPDGKVWGPDPRIGKECLRLGEETVAMARRILAAKVAANVRDKSLWYLLKYTDLPMTLRTANGNEYKAWMTNNMKALCEYRLKLLKDFIWIDDERLLHSMMQFPDRGYFQMGIDYDAIVLLDPAYKEFIDEVAKLPNDAIRRLAGAQLAFIERKKSSPTAAMTPPLPFMTPKAIQPPAPEEPNSDVVFHPLSLKIVRPGAGEMPLDKNLDTTQWIPTGKDFDLVAHGRNLYLMREKGRLVPQPISLSLFDLLERGSHCVVCWDGRYIWAVVSANKATDDLVANDKSWVAVIDPENGKVYNIGVKDGLPPMNKAVMGPLAVGKVFMSGFTDRTWCATVSFDPKGPNKVDVFHEARETVVPENNKQDQNAPRTLGVNTAFKPSHCYVVAGVAADGKTPEQRVVLGRFIAAAGLTDCVSTLLIDPEKRSVEVLDRKVLWTRDAVFCNNQWCWAENVKPVNVELPATLYRTSLPKLDKEQAIAEAPFGTPFVEGSRIHVLTRLNRQWYTADSPTGAFRRVQGGIPKFAGQSYQLGVSRHYGLLFLCEGGAFQVELKQPTKK